MAAIPYSVAEAFRNGRPAHSGAFVSTGDGLYSYALKIAQRDPATGEITILVPLDSKGYSVTTSRHLSAARGVLA